MADGWQITEAVATAVAAVGTIGLGVATYRVARRLDKIEERRDNREKKAHDVLLAQDRREQEQADRDAEAHALAMASQRPHLQITEYLRQSTHWQIGVQNPKGAPDLFNICGTFTRDGDERAPQTETYRTIKSDGGHAFTAHLPDGWIIEAAPKAYLAPGVRLVFRDGDGAILAEESG